MSNTQLGELARVVIFALMGMLLVSMLYRECDRNRDRQLPQSQQPMK